MGQISEDMLDGSCCQLCGQYFCHPKDEDAIYVHGFPVVCWDCWPTLNKKQKEIYEKSDVETF
jgi:hypothetical protein